MTASHLRFRHLDAAVLTATAALLEARTSELPPGEALAEFQRWADAASAAYGLPRVTIVTGPAASGDASAPVATLRLPRPGIVALLAAYRRHMQHHGITPAGTPDEDACSWALSLYHTVRPRQLARLTAAGKIPNLTTADLTAPELAGTGALPIDDAMRRAIFAALRDRYGDGLSRDDRLDKLSLLAGRQIRSTNALSRAQGRRVLGVLGVLGGDPADPADPDARRLLRDARAFIRRAALAGRITTADRDRYLAMIDDEQRGTRGTAALGAAIRSRAIGLYRSREICSDGLDGFLHAAGLAPHCG